MSMVVLTLAAGLDRGIRRKSAMADKPNILLVHGAWGDASHWRHVIPPLHEKGYRVFAVQNPLTSLCDDIDRTSKLTVAQDAPTLLVGHAYGCAVITGAGLTPNVVGLFGRTRSR